MAMSQFCNEYVIKFHKVFLHQEIIEGVQFIKLCIVMQFASGGDLFSRIQAEIDRRNTNNTNNNNNNDIKKEKQESTDSNKSKKSPYTTQVCKIGHSTLLILY